MTDQNRVRRTKEVGDGWTLGVREVACYREAPHIKGYSSRRRTIDYTYVHIYPLTLSLVEKSISILVLSLVLLVPTFV